MVKKLFWEECKKGKSLVRTFQNLYLSKFALRGDVLDVGAKDGQSSYYRFIDISDCDITFCDYASNNPDVLKIDLEKLLPLEDQKYDAILLMNVLEHIYNYQNLCNEIYRILKPGGRLIGTVPFLVPYHPDPYDHFRFTHTSVKRILIESGFRDVQVTPLGCGILTSGIDLMAQLIKFKPLKYLTWKIAIWADRFIAAYSGSKGDNTRLQYYSSVGFIATKL